MLEQLPVFALVQHGNQYLICSRYNNREGISEIIRGFRALLHLHLDHAVRLNMHLSGTLIEAIAWYDSTFFDVAKRLYERGLLECIGSTYSQNIMVHSSPTHNLRQMNEALMLYQYHIGVDPSSVRVFWSPERTWSTDILGNIIQSSTLLNGGYKYVILDDRLSFSVKDAYESSEREQFDQSFDHGIASSLTSSAHLGRHSAFTSGYLAPYYVPNLREKLVVIPICRELRYLIPPHNAEAFDLLQKTLYSKQEKTDAIYLYADDMEKSVRVGSWGPPVWNPEYIEPYGNLLQWLSKTPEISTVKLSDWLANRNIQSTLKIDEGTYYELAVGSSAGENYSRWWNAVEWQPYRKWLEESELALTKAPTSFGDDLWDLAWKQFMACSYETAWHNLGIDGRWYSAPWAKALASHSRAVFVISYVAMWQLETHHSTSVMRFDIDQDGYEEIVLANSSLFAVFTPNFGGRLVYLFDLRGPNGQLIIGNPADDWHWEQSLNSYIMNPPNHPGAFADSLYENDQYKVEILDGNPQSGTIRFENIQIDSPFYGSSKSFRLDSDCTLYAEYDLTEREVLPITIEIGISPDYLTLLRYGPRFLVIRPSRNGFSCLNKNTRVILTTSRECWMKTDPSREVGHCILFQVTAQVPKFGISLQIDRISMQETTHKTS